jgi:ubiquinone/menaquinone biosynthesis C-methylase UbiE
MSWIYQAFQRTLLRLSKKFSRAGLYEWLNEVVSSIPSSEKNVVLSVGAGGDVSELIGRRIGARVTEVDIDPARKPDIVADVCDMNMFADQSVDVIFMVEVLEHVKTPQRALDEMHRVLKPGGRLFLSTPFILPIHDAPYDFYRYTQFGLAHLCRGFQHVKIRPRNDYLASVVVLMMRSVQVSGARRQLASGAIIAMALVLYPFARLLALIYQSDLATTGYVVSAVRGSVP